MTRSTDTFAEVLGDLQIIYPPPGHLKNAPRNPRTHSKKQVRQIADSIREFGFINPVLIDDGRRVIAGHGRLAAARLLKMETVPAIRIDHMSEAQKRAYVIADNRLAENAGWDREILSIESVFWRGLPMADAYSAARVPLNLVLILEPSAPDAIPYHAAGIAEFFLPWNQASYVIDNMYFRRLQGGRTDRSLLMRPI